MLGVLQAPRAESEEPSLLHPNDHLLHVGRVFLAWFFLCLDAFSEQERRRTGFDEFLRLVVSCLIVRFYPGVGRKTVACARTGVGQRGDGGDASARMAAAPSLFQ